MRQSKSAMFLIFERPKNFDFNNNVLGYQIFLILIKLWDNIPRIGEGTLEKAPAFSGIVSI
ncbi:hypothetical protein [Sphingobacterium sp. LRF_L2]|uniref:hypothetical protein n=1 Tax=Sphingobacterium sp. LRF_L2 TaxID=3369421 RepID=UPI003F63A1BD